MGVVSRGGFFLSRCELSIHPNHYKSAIVVAFYHEKSIDLL